MEFVVIRYALYLLALLFGCMVVVCQFYLDTWLGDLVNNFRLQYAVGYGILFLMALTFADKTGVLVLFFFTIFFLFTNINNEIIENADKNTRGQYTLTTFNVFTHNWNYGKIINNLEKINSDIVILQEVSDDLFKMMKSHSWDYKYSVKNYAGRDNIVILSKYPIFKHSRRSNISEQVSKNVLQVICNLPTGLIRIMAIHLTNPVEYKNFKIRTEELKLISGVIGNDIKNLIVAGDFNTTPWSYYMYQFVGTTRLRLINSGSFYQPTWMRHVPLITIPIDHVLVGSMFTIKNRSVGRKNIGSDHYPVTVTFDYDQKQ